MNDFNSLALSPSIAHGSAAPGSFSGALNDTINSFVSNRNIEDARQSILWSAEDIGLDVE